MKTPKAKRTVSKKRPAGRPKVDIDWERVAKLCEAGASAVGIAATLGISSDTLYNRCKDELNSDFSAFSQEKRAKGDELLRTAQFKNAMAGNVTMQIWLGKQRLGQSEKHEVNQNVSGSLDLNLDAAITHIYGGDNGGD